MERLFENPLELGLDDYWCQAHHYVQQVMSPLDGNGIAPNSSEHIHVIIKDIDKPLVKAVVRQICLTAHYLNFDEENGKHRTVITIYSDNPERTYKEMNSNEPSMSRSPLGNLLKYCICKVNGKSYNNQSYLIPLDLEFEFLTTNNDIDKQATDVTLDYKTIKEGIETCDITQMDITMGMLVNMVYKTGVEIDNLPATDNANVNRYSTALNVFCYKLRQNIIQQEWNGCMKMDKLSSIFCADCFKNRLKGILDITKRSLSECILQDFNAMVEKINNEEILKILVKCEHARWNVEKLIMGFEPLQESDWYELECCFGAERKNKIKDLKRIKHKHIDLCSYRNLLRVNPADIKYDYFLMLAMPQIMRRYLLAKETIKNT